jgi:hypothetical protein
MVLMSLMVLMSPLLVTLKLSSSADVWPSDTVWHKGQDVISKNEHLSETNCTGCKPIPLQGLPLQPKTAVQISVACAIPVLRYAVPGFIIWPKCRTLSLMFSNDFPVSSRYIYLKMR